MTPPNVTKPIGDRDKRTLLQRRTESILAQHDYMVELRGPIETVAWPPLCPNCGEVASEGIDVPKIFRWPAQRGRRSTNGVTYRVHTARIPFCATCVARHHELVVRPTLASAIRRAVLTPLMIPVIGSIWMLTITVPAARGTPMTGTAGLIGWGLVALPVFIIVWTLALSWRATLWDRVEKQTEVTLACDFSGDVSDLFEWGQRHLYSIRNKAFAERVATLNVDRLWTAEDDARSSKRRTIVAVVFLAVLAAVAAVRLLGRS